MTETTWAIISSRLCEWGWWVMLVIRVYQQSAPDPPAGDFNDTAEYFALLVIISEQIANVEVSYCGGREIKMSDVRH